MGDISRIAGWIVFVVGGLLTFAAYGGLYGLDRSGMPIVGAFAHWWMLWVGIVLAAAGLAMVVVRSIGRRRPHSPTTHGSPTGTTARHLPQ